MNLPPPIHRIDRILISRMKFIGDVVLTTPIVRATRERFPSAFIAYLGEKEAVSLLEHNPFLDEIVPFDFSKLSVFEQPRVMLQVRKKRFDVLVDLFSNPRTALIARASGAPVRIGKKVAGRGSLYTHQVDDDGIAKTAIEFHYQYVRQLGVEPTHRRTEIFLTDVEKREARNYLQWQDVDLSKTIVGVYPGATWPAKMWHYEKFADLIDLLRAKLDANVVLLQGPKDRELIQQISNRATGNFTLLPVLKLRQLAGVLSQMKVFVTNDSGPMHIAVAVGTKTVGIFGPGEENIWFPYGSPWYDSSDGHIALRRNVSCHPCHLDVCNREGEDHMECMKLLKVEEVFEAIRGRI